MYLCVLKYEKYSSLYFGLRGIVICTFKNVNRLVTFCLKSYLRVPALSVPHFYNVQCKLSFFLRIFQKNPDLVRTRSKFYSV